jgi:hypothetical protein
VHDGDMAEFMARVLVREGAWIVEPSRYHNDSYIDNFLGRLRHIPSRIHRPPGQAPYRFAERGATGRWFFVWVEDK